MPIFGQHKDDSGVKEELRDAVVTLRNVTGTLERVSVELKVLADDQSSLSKKVGDNERDLRILQNQISKSNGFVDTAKYFGIFLLATLAGGWANLSTKIDSTTARTESNAQSIEQIKKDSTDTDHKLDELATKVASNRETILSAVKDARTRGDFK